MNEALKTIVQHVNRALSEQISPFYLDVDEQLRARAWRGNAALYGLDRLSEGQAVDESLPMLLTLDHGDFSADLTPFDLEVGESRFLEVLYAPQLPWVWTAPSGEHLLLADPIFYPPLAELIHTVTGSSAVASIAEMRPLMTAE